MNPRYLIAPEAADDLLEIWLYIRNREASNEIADHVESVIFDKISYLANFPGGGHRRKDLTDEPLKFLSVYSYLIAYWPEPLPIKVVAILHGNREISATLKSCH